MIQRGLFERESSFKENGHHFVSLVWTLKMVSNNTDYGRVVDPLLADGVDDGWLGEGGDGVAV